MVDITRGTLLLLADSLALVAAQQSALTPALVANLSSTLSSGWNTNVSSLCSQAATTAGTVNNPSGLLACYNVAALENFTGFFAGDLRLYSASQSSLPNGSRVSLNLDFGTAGTVQTLTDTSSPQASNTATRRKRNLVDEAVVMVQKRQLQVQAQIPPSNPASTVRAGSVAAVAIPQVGVKPILASTLNPATVQNSVPPAVLPGERSLAAQQRAQLQVQSPANQNLAIAKVAQLQVSATTTMGSVQTAVVQRPAGQELEILQFVGKLNVQLADSNANGLGLKGSLLPKISLRVSSPNVADQVIDMSYSTRAYLVGIKGSLTPVGTFVLPGRVLFGRDGSVDKAGPIIVTIYTVIFLVMMTGGAFTRLQMRLQYRDQAKQAGSRFVS